MPITFRSKHSPDILMLEAVGRELIGLMGHGGSVPGSLAAEDLPAALARLERALAESPSSALAADREAHAQRDEAERQREQPVKAAHRALPLIEMLRTAIAEGDYVMWDR